MSPRSTKGRKRANVYSFSLAGEHEPEVKDMDKLATREGKSRGEIILAAWMEYRRVHYPGNPQPPLMAQSEDPSVADQISLGMMRKLLRGKLQVMSNPKIQDKLSFTAMIQGDLQKAARVYDRTKDPELKGLIDQVRKILAV